MKVITNLFALIILTLTTVSVKAQTYSLETLQQPYKYLVSPIPITKHDTAWNSLYKEIPMGITFSCFSGAYASATISYDGIDFIRNADTIASGIYYCAFLNAPGIHPADRGQWPAPSQSFVSAEVSGVAVNRILKLEYRNMGIAHANPADSLNYQVWLYEKTGDIEWHWGPSYIADPATVNGSHTGPVTGIITGSTKTQKIYDANLLIDNALSPVLYTNKNIGLPIDTGITGFPTNGTVYRLKRASAGISTVAANKNILVQDMGANTWRISNSKKNNFTYRIINTLGQQILAGQGAVEAEINMQDYAAGVYILSIEDKDGPVVTKLMKL